MSTAAEPRPREILLVDDNYDDINLTTAALQRINQNYHLSVVEDGVQAMNFLRREGRKFKKQLMDDVMQR